MIEAEVADTSSIVNTTIGDLVLPADVVIGAIVRGDQVLMPRPAETIKTGDVVIVMASQRQAQAVERMFSVQVDLF